MPTPSVPTKQRILVYIAARVTAVEKMQELVESYYPAANLNADAKDRLEEAYAILETAQQKLIAALAAQAT